MPNGKRTPRARGRRKPPTPSIPACAEWFLREFLPAFRQEFPAARKSRRHMRNAAIEVLEAMRAMIDETIDWLRHEAPRSPELKRIRVEG